MRIVVLTSASSPYAPLILAPVLDRYAKEIVAIITASSTRSSQWKTLVRVASVAGWRYTILKLGLLARIKVSQRTGSYPTIGSLSRALGIVHRPVSTLRSAPEEEFVRSEQPDMLLSVLFEKIIPPSMISFAAKAALNMHPAPLPRFAGIAPVFWTLSSGESATAVTIHYLDEGIDTGDILMQREVAILPHDSVHSLYLRCCFTATGAICDAIEQVRNGAAGRRRQDLTQRSYFTRPTKSAYGTLRRNGHSLFGLRALLNPKRR